MVKKGPMNRIASWKERWFVLTSNKLTYYTNKDMKELKGEISVAPGVRVEVCLKGVVAVLVRNEVSAK